MFKRPMVHYGATPEPETPYQRAGQAWDERIGSARVQAKNWRLAFFGMLALSGGLAAGLVWQSARGTVTPWVRLAFGAFHRGGAQHPGRPDRAAPELARRL